jgi:hypothetical protein
MAAVLQAPNQLCYYVCWFFGTLFVNYFVHNVSATVSYYNKELLDVRTAITHLGLDKDFFLQQAGRTGCASDTRHGQHPRHWQEKETQVQRKQRRFPRKDQQTASGKAAFSVSITCQRTIVGQYIRRGTITNIKIKNWKSNQIKVYLSHALNTTGVDRPYSEMLNYRL